jgi:hypothetical protein
VALFDGDDPSPGAVTNSTGAAGSMMLAVWLAVEDRFGAWRGRTTPPATASGTSGSGGDSSTVNSQRATMSRGGV